MPISKQSLARQDTLPNVDSGVAFPTTPTANDIFFFNADVASGLDWKDTDETTDLTAATAGDMARYDGTDWIKIINVVGSGGGGGGGSTDRIVLLDGVTYSPGAARNFNLTAAIEARHLLTFMIDGTADAYAIMLSDDFLALPTTATTPATAAGAYTMSTRNGSNTLPTQNQGNNWLLWREDDDSIYFRDSRGSGGSLTITATPLGGGALTTSEQESLSEVRVLRSREFNGTGNGIAVHDSDVTWPTNSPNTFVVTATEYADIERIEFILRQNGKVDLPFVIHKGNLDGITAGNYMPNSPTNTTRIRGIFHYSRIGPANRNMNMPVLNPRFDLMEERREADDNCILIQYALNGTLFTGLFIRARQPAGSLVFQEAKLFYWEDG